MNNHQIDFYDSGRCRRASSYARCNNHDHCVLDCDHLITVGPKYVCDLGFMEVVK